MILTGVGGVLSCAHEPINVAAIADTHAKRGDVKQAPSLMSGGGAKQSPESPSR
jgi:hypothetical protein